MDIWKFEKAAQLNGYSLICGVDEAGRGPLAGPVVAAACMLPIGYEILGANDSKSLTEKKRRELFSKMMEDPRVVYGIGVVDAIQIDQMNILQASLYAMKLAVESLSSSPDYVLVDGNILPSWSYQSEAIIQGDALSHLISCASILAKHTRDQMMLEFDAIYPQYGFAKHKGYGTKMHLHAIKEYGPCPIHRMTFAPLK